MLAHTHSFPTDPSGLPEVRPTETRLLADGERTSLRITPIAKRIGDATVRMLGYEGSVPGPVLRVAQGSHVEVEIENDGDLPGTVHWHGLRLDNRYDGTTLTQDAVPVGGRFTYRLEFPDPGVYWYHPHVREDYGQEMGLYGNIVVAPADPDYWPPAHREVALMLDDVLVEDGRIASFDRAVTDHVAMGRFGNVLLVNGSAASRLEARRGEVVRLYLTNTANTRVFEVAIPGARMKLVGGDSGRVEHERFVESVVLAPSERAVVDVLFAAAGELALQHRTPGKVYTLAAVAVSEEPAEPSLTERFGELRTNAELVAEREGLAQWVAAEPDRTLSFVAEMDLGEPELPEGTALEYYCPMHADVTSHEPGKCPKCHMKLVARPAGPTLAPIRLAQPSHGHARGHEHDHHHGAHEPRHDTRGIEWEDDMVEVNRLTTPANTRWKLVDGATGADGHAIDWRFRVGDRVKIRLVNTMDSDHPMHHPFHVHGAGRFLVLARDGVTEPDLAWKDTVLVPTGQTVDILLDVTHAGRWMAHCHIAEHHESGMMLAFTVEA